MNYPQNPTPQGYAPAPAPRSTAKTVFMVLGIGAMGMFGLCVVAPMVCVGGMAAVGEAAKERQAAEEAAKTPEQRAAEAAAKEAEAAAAQAEKDRKIVAKNAANAAARAPKGTVTCTQLVYQFAQNEVAAQAGLEGHYLTVTGKVEKIRKDFMDDMVVDLKGHNKRFGFEKCSLEFQEGPNTLQRVAGIRKGSQMSFVCKVGKYMQMGSISLKDCTF